MSYPEKCGCDPTCEFGGPGYHRHPCTNPCEWPSCMTEDEQMELVRELREEGIA